MWTTDGAQHNCCRYLSFRTQVQHQVIMLVPRPSPCSTCHSECKQHRLRQHLFTRMASGTEPRVLANSSLCARADVSGTGFSFSIGFKVLSKSEPLTDREPARTHRKSFTEEDSMGLKIQNTGLPPMKVLISKKLHILRPAIEYVQQISNPKKVRLLGDAVCIMLLW